MKEAFRIHVSETKSKLRAEIERLRQSAAEHMRVMRVLLEYIHMLRFNAQSSIK